jgi:hypothetical protein
VGIAFIIRPINGQTFLPGLKFENGTIIIDAEKLLYPGDILHEAGHLAPMLPDVRNSMNDTLPDVDMHRCGELMALGWSYAACLHLSLDPAIVFHSDGYKDESENILQNFAEGRYLGVPGLELRGMAYTKKKAEELNAPPYPKMISWLRKT